MPKINFFYETIKKSFKSFCNFASPIWGCFGFDGKINWNVSMSSFVFWLVNPGTQIYKRRK